jgi:hypothetical protein
MTHQRVEHGIDHQAQRKRQSNMRGIKPADLVVENQKKAARRRDDDSLGGAAQAERHFHPGRYGRRLRHGHGFAP